MEYFQSDLLIRITSVKRDIVPGKMNIVGRYGAIWTIFTRIARQDGSKAVTNISRIWKTVTTRCISGTRKRKSFITGTISITHSISNMASIRFMQSLPTAISRSDFQAGVRGAYASCLAELDPARIVHTTSSSFSLPFIWAIRFRRSISYWLLIRAVLLVRNSFSWNRISPIGTFIRPRSVIRISVRIYQFFRIEL